TRLQLDGPAFSPAYVGERAVQFVAVRDGVYNVWRHEAGTGLARLTNTYTAVTAQAENADGSLTVATLAHGGIELHRQSATTPLAQGETTTRPATTAPAAPPTEAVSLLQDERPYRAYRSMYPRGWLPDFYADRGLTAFGASVFGSDALQFHQYALTALYE